LDDWAFPELYVGDYFADTLHLSALEHRVLARLLRELWLERLSPADETLMRAAVQLPLTTWRKMKPAILPLIISADPRIRLKRAELGSFDGQRLPSADWLVVRRIVFERDLHVCGYCGTSDRLQVDHAIPLSRGGSNRFENLITACQLCNLSKGAKTPEEWCRSRMFRSGPPARVRVARSAKCGSRWILAQEGSQGGF